MNKEKSKEKMPMINVILIAVYLCLTIAGVILFKMGTQKEFIVSISAGVFNLKMSLLSILGLVCYLCSFLLSKFDISYIVPVTTGIVQVATFILAVLIFKETVTTPKVAATILILIGIIIMNIKQ